MYKRQGLDRGKQHVDRRGHDNSAGFQESLLRISQQRQHPVIETEVAHMIANDDVYGLGQRQLEGICLEELGPIGEAGLRDRSPRHLDHGALVDEDRLPRPGAQSQEAKKPGPATEVEYHMIRGDASDDRLAVPLYFHAIGQVTVVLVEGLSPRRIMHSRGIIRP